MENAVSNWLWVHCSLIKVLILIHNWRVCPLIVYLLFNFGFISSCFTSINKLYYCLWISVICLLTNGNGIVKKGCVPEDWKSSVVLPIYKGKVEPMECVSYRGIKLLEHAMKVVEKIFEHRIRQQIDVDDMQFGFMEGKGTTDAIFMAGQVQENFKGKLYFGFVYLEQTFDRVPREVIAGQCVSWDKCTSCDHQTMTGWRNGAWSWGFKTKGKTKEDL